VHTEASFVVVESFIPAVKRSRPTTKTAPAKKAPRAAKSPAPKRKPSATLCNHIAKALATNKAEDVNIIDLGKQCSFADFMIVATGRGSRHVSALADYVVQAARKQGGKVLSIEGKETGDWVLIDTGDIIVHLFRPEVRDFYGLEKMWSIPTTTS
jgi:ribosome-associated protein